SLYSRSSPTFDVHLDIFHQSRSHDRPRPHTPLVQPGQHLDLTRVEQSTTTTNVLELTPACLDIDQRGLTDERPQRRKIHTSSIAKGCYRVRPTWWGRYEDVAVLFGARARRDPGADARRPVSCQCDRPHRADRPHLRA